MFWGQPVGPDEIQFDGLSFRTLARLVSRTPSVLSDRSSLVAWQPETRRRGPKARSVLVNAGHGSFADTGSSPHGGVAGADKWRRRSRYAQAHRRLGHVMRLHCATLP